jgi:hypothetical protein
MHSLADVPAATSSRVVERRFLPLPILLLRKDLDRKRQRGNGTVIVKHHSLPILA